MRDFITCLEFLTRIRFSNRTDWRDDDFAKSVPYFPLVGLVMGLFMAAVNYGLLYANTPLFMRAVLLILAELVIIGALMYDGFMDTSDGVFSARNRERMLEIMKDSHVGSNAVIALVCLVLLKIAAIISSGFCAFVVPPFLKTLLLSIAVSNTILQLNSFLFEKEPVISQPNALLKCSIGKKFIYSIGFNAIKELKSSFSLSLTNGVL